MQLSAPAPGFVTGAARPSWKSFAAVLAALTVAACQPTDLTGGPRGQPVLRLDLATRTLGPGASAAFAAQLGRQTEGRIRVDIETSSHRDLGAGADDAILADVAAGETALGAVSIAALERAGVRSLSPVTAPGLVTTLSSEVALFTSPVTDPMLAGVARAQVAGLAVLPGPVHYFSTTPEAVGAASDLSEWRFGIFADSSAARAFVRALDATPIPDNKADSFDQGIDAADLSALTVNTRSMVSRSGTIVANVPLWPDPTVLVMNPKVLAELTARDKSALSAAASASIQEVASLQAKDDAEALVVLCLSGWTVTEADEALRRGLQPALDAAVRSVKAEDDAPALMEDVERLMRVQPAPVPLACPGSRPTSDPRALLPKALVGTWQAQVTQAAVERQGLGPHEFGLVGRWVLRIDQSGRMTVTFPDGGVAGAAVEATGEVVMFDVDRATDEQGLGERWRLRWSVFHDTLTLERAPAPGSQDGPVALVSQPFRRR